jgi:tetratricopeptide (TPR) repeat protein
LLHAGKAVELEPLNLMTNFRLLQANYYSRRYEEAIRCGRIAVELTPDSPYTYFYLALSLAAVGLKDEAWTMGEHRQKTQRWATARRRVFWLCSRTAGTHSRGSQRGWGAGGPS